MLQRGPYPSSHTYPACASAESNSQGSLNHNLDWKLRSNVLESQMQAAIYKAREPGTTAGWNKMAETIEQFISRRRNELDAEIVRLEAEIEAVRIEREKLEQVAVMLGSQETRPSERALVAQGRAPRRLSEATIKMTVLNLLHAFPAGQTALEILERINRTVDAPYPRTSLSPQLSRLKTEGKIHRIGRVWTLGSGPNEGGGDGIDADEPKPESSTKLPPVIS